MQNLHSSLTTHHSSLSLSLGQWKKYFVYLAGDTGGAHQDFLLFVNQARQSQVLDPQDSDYILVFCPILSDVAAEVQRALEYIPGGKITVGTNHMRSCNGLFLNVAVIFGAQHWQLFENENGVVSSDLSDCSTLCLELLKPRLVCFQLTAGYVLTYPQ